MTKQGVDLEDFGGVVIGAAGGAAAEVVAADVVSVDVAHRLVDLAAGCKRVIQEAAYRAGGRLIVEDGEVGSNRHQQGRRHEEDGGGEGLHDVSATRRMESSFRSW